MNLNETRSSHPSSAQVEFLVEFMERNPRMAKGFFRTQSARERSRRQWEALTVRLNSMGGTIKNYKQWTKYWSDKKSAIKKKTAARSAARRRTDGGVEEDKVELSELEERIVALCGGESFATGDAHLRIQVFPENETPSPSHEAKQIQDAVTDDGSELIENTPTNRLPDPVVFRLFASSSSSTVGTSQSILRNIQIEDSPPPDTHTCHPSLSPPPIITLSHTPTPSHSCRGATPAVVSPVIRRRTAASSSLRHAMPTSRRPMTNMARASRGAGSVSSRHASSVAPPPPSQRRKEFFSTTRRFLRVEEQQLEIQRQNAQILQSFLERSAERERAMDERSAERDRILAEAVAAVGKGLQALAEAMNRDRL